MTAIGTTMWLVTRRSGDVCALVSLTFHEWRNARVRTASPLAQQADLERVIEALQAVVDDSDQDARTTPVLHDIAHRGLAYAFITRIGGCRLENIKKAVSLLERALQLVPRATAPLHWAKTQNNLGIAYSNGVDGHRAPNVEAAMACYRLALEVRTREQGLRWIKLS